MIRTTRARRRPRLRRVHLRFHRWKAPVFDGFDYLVRVLPGRRQLRLAVVRPTGSS